MSITKQTRIVETTPLPNDYFVSICNTSILFIESRAVIGVSRFMDNIEHFRDDSTFRIIGDSIYYGLGQKLKILRDLTLIEYQDYVSRIKLLEI